MKKTIPRQILLLALGCLLGGCQRPTEPARVRSQHLLAIFGNQQAIDVVQMASDVHVYRLAEASFYQDQLSSYERSGDAVTVSQAEQLQLRDLLLFTRVIRRHFEA